MGAVDTGDAQNRGVMFRVCVLWLMVDSSGTNVTISTVKLKHKHLHTVPSALGVMFYVRK